MNLKIGIHTDSVNFSHTTDNTINTGYALHCHNFYEVYYFVRGDVSYLVEGKRYVPTPHSILIMAPNVFHGVKIDSNTDYERFALHFLPNILSIENRVLLLSPFSKATGESDIYFENVNDFKMLGFFENLLDCTAMSSDIKEVAIKIRIEALLSQILFMSRSTKVSSFEEPSRSVVDIIAYINEHLTETITLDNLSNIFY